jgi:hypothetical protein
VPLPARVAADAIALLQRLFTDTGRKWTDEEIDRYGTPTIKAAKNLLRSQNIGGIGVDFGGTAPPPAVPGAGAVAGPPSARMGMGYGEPEGAWKEVPYRFGSPSKDTYTNNALKPGTPAPAPAAPKTTAPAPAAPAPRGGGGGGGGGGGAAEDNGLPEQWNTFFNKIFGPMETYYTPERGGIAQAATDYKTFQNLWSGKLNRWLTPEELARALGEFYAIAETLKGQGHTVTLGDLYSWVQRQIYKLPAPPTVTPIKPGEV